jgi:hypothetical protein
MPLRVCGSSPGELLLSGALAILLVVPALLLPRLGDPSPLSTLSATLARHLRSASPRAWSVENKELVYVEVVGVSVPSYRESTVNDQTQNIVLAPFGNPAASKRPVALRPRLAMGLPFSWRH